MTTRIPYALPAYTAGIIFFSLVCTAHGQNTDLSIGKLQEQIEQLDKRVTQQSAEVISLTRTNRQLTTQSKRLSNQLSQARDEIDLLLRKSKDQDDRLGTLLKAQEQSHRSLKDQQTLLDLGQNHILESLNTRSVLLVAVICSLLLVLFLIWRILGHRLANTKLSLDDKVLSTASWLKSLEDRIAGADTKLAELLAAQLQGLKSSLSATTAHSMGEDKEYDHSLPLRLADELIRMKKRLDALPLDTKGIGPLKKSLERLESELSDLGYEVVDLTGKKFNEGLQVKARFIPDDSLSEGEQLITKVVRPQVNFKGQLIQPSEIEVGTGYKKPG